MKFFLNLFNDKGLQIVFILSALFMAVDLAYNVYSTFGTKSVTIDSSRFSCTGTEPNGIEARCTQYTWIKGAR